MIAYLHYEAPVEEQNFATLLEMLNTMQVLEDDEEYQNPVDLLFEDLGKEEAQNPLQCGSTNFINWLPTKRLSPSLFPAVPGSHPLIFRKLRDATMYDELELDKLGDRKTALFLIMSDTDSTFNFLISMIYTQLFNSALRQSRRCVRRQAAQSMCGA